MERERNILKANDNNGTEMKNALCDCRVYKCVRHAAKQKIKKKIKEQIYLGL